jgi:cellulose synthase/poly-beta-1,6-N-acetylglucosamine synthase-like glycosyltransferase
MISVGITIPLLNTLIIQQLNSNEETTSQILARALNLDYANKIADIWIFVLDNTVDENWCKKSLNWIPSDKINHINYKDL